MSKKIVLLLTVCCFVLSSFVGVAGAEKLTYWVELHGNVAQVTKNFGDLDFAKEFQKRTGVEVEFLHPPAGQAREAFNLLIAGGDLPDIIEYDWANRFPGGPAKAIEDGYIIKLNDVLDQAPNLKAYLESRQDIDKQVKTDEGYYYVFPFIRGDDSLLVTAGLILREDWLTDLGLEAPTTIDEWYNTLVAFKEQKGAEAPLTLNLSALSRSFSPAFGFYGTNNFYIEDGQVKYAFIQPGLKDFLAEMSKWYAEGLIAKDFANVKRKQQDDAMLNNKAGATYGSGGSGIGRWMAAMKGKDDKFNLIGVRIPGPAKDQIAEYGNWALNYRGYGSAAISAACAEKEGCVESAVKLLDYLYGEEGHMLVNFGLEGVSYSIEEGYPTYSDLIFNHPDGLPMTQAMSFYMRGHTRGPFIQDPRYLEQYYALQTQKDAMAQWRISNQKLHNFPPVTPTSEENEEISTLMADIETFSEEMRLKFIMGVESLDKFDDYVAQIEKMGIGKVLELYQTALARYEAR